MLTITIDGNIYRLARTRGTVLSTIYKFIEEGFLEEVKENKDSMNKQVKMDFACKKCGAIQKRDESRSNENWNTFDGRQKCECGESFSIRLDGEFLSKK